MKSFALERLVAAYCRQIDCRFVVQDAEEDPLVIFSPEMFLPVVLAHAQGICIGAVRQRLGIKFVRDPAAIFWLRSEVAPIKDDPLSVLRLACTFEAAKQLFGLVHSTYVDVSPVYNAFAVPRGHEILEGVANGVVTARTWPMARLIPKQPTGISAGAFS